MNAPPDIPGGAVVVMVSWWWSFCRDFGDGGSGRGFVDDGFAGGERGDEGLDGEVVDRSGDASADLRDQGVGVGGNKQGGGASQCGVVADGGLGLGTTLAVHPKT